ncbi:putative permease [Actinoplanes friuliensis DSM 7358]|uniref:Putative permease n=1 Tax=Actinoplanes friuliensis DSM 7358 TaxID=1246995 RepID=U5VWB3_9ACTN|nr:putative permease [Actinoplanes friuliensis DSM 7358]
MEVVGRPARLVMGVVAASVLTVTLLAWAKWMPYAAKVPGLAASHGWAGADVLRAGGVQPGDAPSWSAATSFTWAYGKAVWRALLAALLISAALQTLIPKTWLVRVLNRPGRLRSAMAGGLAGTPSMMCACCTAPVAVGLKRRGVSTAAVVAYWLGNPLLNPAVLVFLLLVAPWQRTATRLVVGVLVVVGGAALVSWLADGRAPAAAAASTASAASAAEDADDPPPSVRRYLSVLLRSSVILLPEYLVVVMLIGAFRGWLFPLGEGSGLLVVLVAALVGTALVIPTAGEIPIAQGLALAGLSLGGVGALLVTLPAVSLPGMIMVGKAFGWRVTVATAAVAAAGGIAAAGLLPLLSA